MGEWVHPRERTYFVLSLAASVLAYVALIVSMFGILFLLLFALVAFLLHGWSMGQIRGNAVRVSERQFPEVHRVASELAEQMGLSELPAIYVLQQGGALNAFATKFVRRDFVVVYSDFLELAYEEGEPELAFVIGHELAHVRRRHVFWQWLLAPARMVPFLAQAYSRACEYTCDRIAVELRPDGIRGLLVLAAGKRLYRTVDSDAFAEQSFAEQGFWIWFSEVLSSHPRLPKRVRALEQAGVGTRSLVERHAPA